MTFVFTAAYRRHALARSAGSVY